MLVVQYGHQTIRNSIFEDDDDVRMDSIWWKDIWYIWFSSAS